MGKAVSDHRENKTEMKTLDELLEERLSVAVRNKTGDVLTNEQGDVIYPMEAMVTSVVQNAMHGDLPSLSFIHNIMKKQTDDPEYRRRQKAMLDQNKHDIKAQLVADGIYDETMDFQIERLAGTLLAIQRLEGKMMEPGHEDVSEEMNRVGQISAKVSAINQVRQKALKQFDADLAQLRNTAMQRAVIRKTNSRK